MKQLVECVPNFSEGRDKDKINDIVQKMSSVSGITVLDVDMGSDTNRTVVTIVGSPEAVGEAAFQGIKHASEILDMAQHSGTHPRMGATDVCPFIPVSGVSIDECIALSKEVGKRAGETLDIPIYLYEKSAQKSDRKKLPTIRKGEYEGLGEKLKDQNWKPDFGPAIMHAKAGATVMGCREFLIAYNINLNTKDHRLATDIAFELREAGRSKRTPNPDSKNLLDGKIVRHEDGKPIKTPGMFKDVKGIGWYVEEFNRAQISINFNNYKVSTIHDVFDAACKLAEERGVRVTGSELVGLIPLEAILMAGKHYLKKQNRSLGVPTDQIIECAIQSLGLDDVTEFNPNEKIIDYAVGVEERPLMALTGSAFIDELSSNSPAPGGGSVSALAGSLGAALSSMVAALTHEKKEMLSSKPEMDSIGSKAQKLKERLSFLVDKDTEAFNKVMSANRLLATTEEEKREKTIAVELANKYAIDIPLETAEKSYRVIELAEMLVEKGNPNSVSDAGVAAEVALAGVRGACMNVLINLPGIKDKTYISAKKEVVSKLVSDAEKLHKIVYEKTINTIESKR
ncbi:MAG: glutamate formimidoyltransferase [Candidatus Marinimicrobia bacterium]|jgi:glutamate formiminotransferase/formiminotetrahydrofolate cyclodeaminase|nr:glutamate formimidoyltransferase [Candidatus Neomarinimicrobiota bacterium]MBT3495800.1 glutamate formimidoyltransferase [Candidatus Neomarinimicrobiota bacterium]MBT3691639.1 glutamate formimidoyltransferase [Candidatus Neomarinimicrobiota bacterium]MBT3732732.1 glutamate formimidoyltransferase [Candidatus Neomarinimicrobiota bacterium]MBT4145014.1 glutamate formimidoyltransferase [Candidatus Neomarinimicrobiota bacterium]